MDFNTRYQDYKEIFEAELKNRIDGINSSNQTLKEAMEYSLTVGGKRIRPVIMLAVAEILCVEFDKVLPFAVALECIHTHSLFSDKISSACPPIIPNAPAYKAKSLPADIVPLSVIERNTIS